MTAGIGVMDTPELAAQAVDAFNRAHFVTQNRMHESLELSSRIALAFAERCGEGDGCADGDDGSGTAGTRTSRQALRCARAGIRER